MFLPLCCFVFGHRRAGRECMVETTALDLAKAFVTLTFHCKLTFLQEVRHMLAKWVVISS